ncbi:MAG: glycosyltransferase [Candidatus Pacebacteria bacterium]|nr:glycosyltransferase [Candidatus Paceibacterota bacterium]
MRIVIASGIYPPDIGGPATYTLELATRLAERGSSIEVVTYSKKQCEQADATLPFSITRIVRRGKLINRIHFFRAAYRALEGADIVYTLDWFAAGLPVALAAKLRGAPYIVRVGGDYLWEQKYLESGAQPVPLKVFYERGLYRRLSYYPAFAIIRYVLSGASIVIFNSDAQRELYTRYYRLPQTHCLTIGNPVPSVPEIKRDTVSKEFVFWGRLIVMKNIDSLLRAFAKARLPSEYTLAIIGDGPRKEELMTLAKALGSASRVRFQESLSLREVLERVKNARAFVLPSWTDIAPNQVYEALAIGLPTLVTKENYLAIRDLFPMTIDPSSVDDIASKLEALADDTAYAEFSSRFTNIHIDRDWETVVNEHVALFEQTLDSGEFRVLQIGADRSKRGILYPGSPAFERQQAYARAFGKLDILGFSKISDGAKPYADTHLSITPTNSTSSLRYGYDALRIAKKMPRPSVVSAQDPFETGLVAWLIARRLRAPLHVQVHTDFLAPAYTQHSLVNRIRVHIAWFVLKRAKRIRVVSAGVKQVLSRALPNTAVTVLPIFADLEKIRAAKIAPELAARFEHFAYKLLVVARLEPEKNVELAIRAFAASAPKDTCLIVVGEGSERERLAQLSHQLGVAERVFFEGEKSSVEYYPLADLVLVTSDYEGYGLVIVEALAAGKPVFSTDVGVAREAGAIVSSEKDFPKNLGNWFQEGSRTGELKDYPYTDFSEYARAYSSDIRACTSPKLSL